MVDDKHDRESANSGPCGSKADPSHLVAKLNPVAVQPTTIDCGEAVVGSDRGLCENASHEESNHAADPVACEDIESVIEVEPDF